MITDQDRATARRVIRRHHGPDPRRGNWCSWHLSDTCPCAFNGLGPAPASVWDAEDEAAEAASLGRAYGKALRGAK